MTAHSPDQESSPEFRPRSRLISVVANTGAVALILASFALWHDRQVNTLETSYVNRIGSLQSEIRALSSTGRLDDKSAEIIEQLFSELGKEKDDTTVRTVGVVLLGVGVSFILTTLIATIVVLRNRIAVSGAFREGFVKGATQQALRLRSARKPPERPVPRTPTRPEEEASRVKALKEEMDRLAGEIDEVLEESEEEFKKNYVQRGGE